MRYIEAQEIELFWFPPVNTLLFLLFLFHIITA